MILNFNYHLSSRAGIGKIICPKRNEAVVIAEMEKKGMEKVLEGYNPLGLSPRNNNLG